MNVKSVIVKASAIMVATGVMCSVKAIEPKSISVDSCPWPVEELLKVPQTFSAAQYVGQQVSGVTALLYESVPYRGNPSKKDWHTVPATLAPGVVTATLPEDTAAFFFNVYDEPGPAAPAGIAWPSSSEYKYISLTALK